MPAVSDNQRIRQGLKFLTKADKVTIRASDPLLRLMGVKNPPKVKDVLAWYAFSIAGNDYQGRMSQEQATYLKKFTTDLKTFADAIARLLIVSNHEVLDAIKDLGAALETSEKVKVAGSTALPVGCCSYDTNLETGDMTQSYCEGGLQGTWDPNPCRSDGKGKKNHPAEQKEK